MSSFIPSSPATSAAMAGSLMNVVPVDAGVNDQTERARSRPLLVEARRGGLNREFAPSSRDPDCPAGTMPTPSMPTRAWRCRLGGRGVERRLAAVLVLGTAAQPIGQVVEGVQRGADGLAGAADAEDHVVAGLDPVAQDVVAECDEMCCAGGVSTLRQVVDGVARVGGACVRTSGSRRRRRR